MHGERLHHVHKNQKNECALSQEVLNQNKRMHITQTWHAVTEYIIAQMCMQIRNAQKHIHHCTGKCCTIARGNVAPR